MSVITVVSRSQSVQFTPATRVGSGSVLDVSHGTTFLTRGKTCNGSVTYAPMSRWEGMLGQMKSLNLELLR